MVATGSKLLVVRNCQNSHTLTAQTSKKIYHAVARAGIKRRSRFIHYQYRFIEYLGNRQHNPLSLSTRHLVHTLVIKLFFQTQQGKLSNKRSMLKPVSRLAFNSKGIRTISLTHSDGKASSCGIHAIFRRTKSAFRGVISTPSTLITPSLIGTNPKTAFNNEVFPLPESPQTQTLSPRFTCKLRCLKSNKSPKLIDIFFISIISQRIKVGSIHCCRPSLF